ncbi:MAG: hypothetical protein ACYDH3_03640 [Candidatus Aminicenantales bacterium]
MMIFRRNAAKKRRRTGVISAVVLVAILAPAVSADVGEKSPPAPRFGPLEKSLLFPGWGQISEHRVLKGAAFAAAELALLAGAIHYNGRGNSAYDVYRSAGDAASAVHFRRLVERNDGRRNACLLAAAAVWAVNLLDIHLLVNRKDPGLSPRSFTVGITHGPTREICLSLACRF